MRRKSTTVTSGFDLFNLAYENENTTKSCMKDIIRNLFTTEYDHILIKNEKCLRESSNILCSYLSNIYHKKIPNYVDNGVFNIILDILCEGNKNRSKFDCKKMYHYYMDLAKTAFKNNDHNTCILIKCALEHTVIKRLKIKNTKSEEKLFTKFHETYGDFMSCYSKHIEQILENKNNIGKFVPSAMVLNMHLKKNAIYVDSYSKLGKYPKNLLQREDELKNLIGYIGSYYNTTKKPNTDLINLYKENPDKRQILTPSRRSNSLVMDCFTIVDEIKK